MSTIIGVVNAALASRYIDLDNIVLAGGVIPKLFTISITEEEGISAAPFKQGDGEFFTKFSKDVIGSIVNFDTSKPSVFGTGLKLKLVGIYDNREVVTIFIPSEDENEIIYVFEDVRNNKEIVYIPETVIVYNSITVSGLEVKYIVKCKNPDEEAILSATMRSAGIEFREM